VALYWFLALALLVRRLARRGALKLGLLGLWLLRCCRGLLRNWEVENGMAESLGSLGSLWVARRVPGVAL
jgi:hypothetical protein